MKILGIFYYGFKKINVCICDDTFSSNKIDDELIQKYIYSKLTLHAEIHFVPKK